MNSMQTFGAVALIATAFTVPLRVSAQTARVAPAARITVAPPAAAAATEAPLYGPARHAVYGVIAAVSGSVLTLRTRSGRTRTVDAAPAIAAGTISLPLYIGKYVVAEGLTVTNGVLRAARVTRITRLDNTNPDR